MPSFRKLLVLGIAFISTMVSAAPVNHSKDNVLFKWILDGSSITDCDVSGAQLPLDKTNPQLPPPSAGLHAKYIVIGRGTQNYTCATGDKTAVPESVGAVATLYDISCIASKDSDIQHNLATDAEKIDKDGLSDFADVARLATGINLIKGFHYFDETGTPFFDLRQGSSQDWLATSGKKEAPSPNGAVDWLKLGRKDSHGLQVC
jgi:hypothetical protein